MEKEPSGIQLLFTGYVTGRRGVEAWLIGKGYPYARHWHSLGGTDLLIINELVQHLPSWERLAELFSHTLCIGNAPLCEPIHCSNGRNGPNTQHYGGSQSTYTAKPHQHYGASNLVPLQTE